MPEGDTIHRLAARMRPPLVGHALREVYLRDRGTLEGLTGKQVERVEARGKHLLVTIEGGWVLRAHLGIEGRVFRLRDPDRRPADEVARIVAGDVAWGFYRSARVGLVRQERLHDEAGLASLGPDLLAPELDLDGIVARARRPAHRGQAVADLLLDQRVAAGIGNVYKCEVLFMERVSPFATTSSIGDEALRALFLRARALMRAALARGGTRITVPERLRLRPGTPAKWVYRRANRPCLECGTPIERRVHGDRARTTFYCPSCQAPAPRRKSFA